MKYVIIGNSAAAIGTVESIRKVDVEGSITIISDEPFHTYSRPLISYLLLGKTDEQRMKYRKDDFYKENNCEVMLGKKAVSIDTNRKEVVLEDDSRVQYDKLMVATGSSPFVPPMKGLENVKKAHSFMKLQDAFDLNNDINSNSRVLIIGAGLIGLKCAEGIAAKVANITVVDLAPRILSSILDDEGALLVKNALEKKNIEFMLGDSVSEFSVNNAGAENESYTAKLKSGMSIDCDVVVVAVGVRPNTSLVKDAGGEVNRGIVINDKMQTSLTNVYCAGDCSEGYDSCIEQNRILALLPNAYMQGECAGYNMAGKETVYNNAVPLNAIGFFGLHIATAGAYEGDVYVKKDCDNLYKKLFYKDNRLMGYIMIGNVEKAGIYTKLIREKTPLDSIDFELICEKPGLMAFTRDERSKMLGGER